MGATKRPDRYGTVVQKEVRIRQRWQLFSNSATTPNQTIPAFLHVQSHRVANSWTKISKTDSKCAPIIALQESCVAAAIRAERAHLDRSAHAHPQESQEMGGRIGWPAQNKISGKDCISTHTISNFSFPLCVQPGIPSALLCSCNLISITDKDDNLLNLNVQDVIPVFSICCFEYNNSSEMLKNDIK